VNVLSLVLGRRDYTNAVAWSFQSAVGDRAIERAAWRSDVRVAVTADEVPKRHAQSTSQDRATPSLAVCCRGRAADRQAL